MSVVLRSQLLIYFASIVLIVMLTFGFIAYEISVDTAIDKEKFLLRGIVELKASVLATEYRENPSPLYLEKFIRSDINSEHISFIINHKGGELIPGQLTIAGRDYRLFPMQKILNSKEKEGRFYVGNQFYIWVKTAVSGSPYDLIHIFGSNYDIDLPFSNLAERFVVAGIIITWIAVWVALVISTAVTRRLKAQNDELHHRALHDSLTNLPNRAFFGKRLDHAISMAKDDSNQLALIMMDLDRFKEINDTLGHHIGDFLLQKVAQRLSDIITGNATVARFGGDEFAVLIPKTNLSQISKIVNRIINSISQPINLDGSLLAIDASYGIAFYPEHGNDCTTLIQRADVAMYQAKQSNTDYAIYDQSRDPHSLEKLTLMNELRHAIEHNELLLYYQPKIDIKSNQVTGVEALLKWQHPRHGLLNPDRFILLAEQTGMIKPLTIWALQTAVKDCVRLHQARHPIAISVNMSAVILQDLRVPKQISDILTSHNLSSDYLELEITETAIMKDPQQAFEILTDIHRLGVRLSIDDFGTGYTCLSYLKQLPIDEIKIDKSFVMNMLKDKNDAMIVYSIIDLAHHMGHKVIAEGVVNKKILDKLEHQDCDKAQGFHFSKAMPFNKLVQYLASRRYH